MTATPNPTAEPTHRELLLAEAAAVLGAGPVYAGTPWPGAKTSEIEAYVSGVNKGHSLLRQLTEALLLTPDTDVTVLDPEKVAEVIAYANTALDDLPSPGSTAESLARALCEAYMEGKLT